MKTLKKLSICLLTAIYVLTSMGDVSALVKTDVEPAVLSETADSGSEDGVRAEDSKAATEIEHGQHVESGNNEMNVALIDRFVTWNSVDGREDAVKKATNTLINEDATALLFQYKIEINLDRVEYVNYEAGGVCITIPRTIFRSYNAYNSSSPTLGLDTGVGVFHMDNLFNESTGFKATVEGDKIKITNIGVLKSRSIEITLSYKPDKMSPYYPDYDPENPDSCGSLPFDVDLTLTSNTGATSTLQAQAPRVFIDTNARVASLTKEYSDSWRVTTKEGDEDVPYLYVQFMVNATFDSEAYRYPTQAFTYDLTDVFSGYGDITYNDGKTDFEWEFLGWATYKTRNIPSYSLTNNHSITYPALPTSVTRYALFRIIRPESMYIDYKIENTATVTVTPRWGVDPVTTDSDDASYGENYLNTNPHGMYFVHNWSNTNWESDAHHRVTQQHGYHAYFEHPWKNANREIDRFANQQNDIFGNPITELRGLRYFTWYYGYPSLGQTTPNRVKFVAESKDMTYSKSSSHPTTPNSPLGTDKYFLKELGFYLEAKYAEHNGKYWVEKTDVDPYLNDHEPVYVYALVDGKADSNWKLICTVEYDVSQKKWNKITVNPEQADNVKSASYTRFEGEDNYHYGSDTGIFIEFANQNIYGYRIENVNKHYFFFIGVRANYSIKSTETTRDYCGAIGGGHSRQYYLFTYNFADMDVYNWNYTTATEPGTAKSALAPIKAATSNPGDRVFRFSETESKADRVAGAIAAGENNSLSSEKTLLETEEQGKLNRYRSRWKLEGWHFFYGSIAETGEYYPSVETAPMEGGIFYDVLPRGAVLEDMDNLKNSIKVYKNPLWTNHYVEPSQAAWDKKYLLKNSPNADVIDSKFLMDPADYEVELLTDNLNGTDLGGLMVLVVKINKRSEGYQGPIGTDATVHYLSGGYTVVFDTYTTYSILAEQGSRIVNAMCFEAKNNMQYNEKSYADNPEEGIRTKDTNPLAPLKTTSYTDYDLIMDILTDVDPTTNQYIFSYSYAETTASYDSVAMAGPSKFVAGDDGELVMELEVEPGATYTYYLRYGTSSNSSAKNLKFVDKIEAFSNSEVGPSQWHGKLMGISAEDNAGNDITGTFYISTKADADQYEFTDSSVWTVVDGSTDLSTAIWIGADLGEYEVKPLDVAFVKLTMQAPLTNETNYVKPETYNNYHISGSLKDVSTGQTSVINNVTNYTTVKYTVKGNVQIEKVDEEGTALEGVKFTLSGTTKFGTPVNMTATTDTDGKAVFENVDISGSEDYVLTETLPSGYISDKTTWDVKVNTDGSTTIDGEDSSTAYYRIVNYKETKVIVQKIWDDNDDEDGYRPESVVFTLYAGEDEVGSITLDGTADENGETKPWYAEWDHLPKQKNGVDIVYTVKETSSDVNYEVIYGNNGETFAVHEGTITNKYIRVTTEVSVIKAWDDNDDQDGVRPESVTFTLYAGENEVSSITLDGTVDENGELEAWKATWKDLPEKENGVDIVYTVKETSNDVNYTVIYGDHNETYAVNGGTITNQHIPTPTEVSVKKAWDDNDDQDGVRPESVTFTLYAGETEVSSITLDGTVDENGESEAWKATWKNLPKKANGVDIVYTVKETSRNVNYTVIYGDHEETFAVDGGTIINMHIPGTTEVSVIKVWDDNDDQDGVRPESVTFTLYAGENEVSSITLDGTVDENGELEAWKATWKDLPEKENGVDIVYTVKETSNDVNYTVIYGDNEETFAVDGGTITNQHIPTPTEVSVKKAWDDNDDQDGVRPDSVTFTLYGNGKEISSITLDGTVDEDGESEAWKATWKNLPQKEAGKEIVYTVEETSRNVNYTVIYGDHEETFAVNGGTITNMHSPELITLNGEKKWKDNDDQDGVRPESIIINLYADGTKIDSVTVTKEDNWKFEFKDLPKYKEGKEIKYTITEEDVDGYETEIQDLIVINTHEPEKTEVVVIKIWVDSDNEYEKRPISITVHLFADGKEIDSAVLTEEGGWTHTFEDLDKYFNGKEIMYTITEDPVPEYQTEIDGYVITNTFTVDTGDNHLLMIYSLAVIWSLLAFVTTLCYLKKKELY